MVISRLEERGYFILFFELSDPHLIGILGALSETISINYLSQELGLRNASNSFLQQRPLFFFISVFTEQPSLLKLFCLLLCFVL